MHKVQLSVLMVLMSLLLVTLTHSAALPDEVSASRNKRQSADVRTAEYLAWIALGGKVPSRGCERVACGVVDVYSSSRIKRQFAEVQAAEYLAKLAMFGQNPNCAEVACGVVDVYARVRRSSADQRIAELQALIALSGSKNIAPVAHGIFDPRIIGKKKRADSQYVSDEERYNILRALLQRAALENASS